MTSGDQAVQLSGMHFWLMFDILFEKGIIGYADVQESVGRLLDRLDPDDPNYPFIKMQAEIISRVYQPGTYSTPLGPRDPKDPQP